ncbi:MAG: PHB depolymerase family esterase [Candidatus Omnitrophota bacterium]
MRKYLLCLMIFALFLDRQGFAAGEMEPANVEGSLVVEGRQRTYLLYIPRGYDASHPVPLVIVLHGGGANAKNAQRMTGFSALAEKKGFMVAYPNGTGRLPDRALTWNAGNCCGYAWENNVNDVLFIRSLIEKLEKEYIIDPGAVYVTGISNGGMLAYKLGCELSDKIAAIGPVAGAMNVDECLPKEPVSVIAFHGTEDRHVLYKGGWPLVYYDRYERKDKPVSHAMSFWSQRDACEARPQEMERGRAKVATWSFCLEGTGVSLYTIVGGGHTWPGGQYEQMWGDSPDAGGISATDIMWEFFDRHSRKRER